MPQLNALVESVLADGKVDASEVKQLRETMLADGQVDRTEADALFLINDSVSDADNDPSWPEFFAEALTSHVLEDEETPGVVSSEEAKYLKNHIHKDGKVDAAERALLTSLRSKAQAPLPTELTFLFELYLD